MQLTRTKQSKKDDAYENQHSLGYKNSNQELDKVLNDVHCARNFKRGSEEPKY